jgi:hypothetical protein
LSPVLTDIKLQAPATKALVPSTAVSFWASVFFNGVIGSVSRGQVGSISSHTDVRLYDSGWNFVWLSPTGEAIVFLKIDWSNPKVLFYRLAEPGPEAEEHRGTFLSCTAVSQMLAFTVLAIDS